MQFRTQSNVFIATTLANANSIMLSPTDRKLHLPRAFQPSIQPQRLKRPNLGEQKGIHLRQKTFTPPNLLTMASFLEFHPRSRFILFQLLEFNLSKQLNGSL